MSTRCQVLIQTPSRQLWQGDNRSNDEYSAMLYHHCDGYPEYMYPTIEKAFKLQFKKDTYSQWQFGRPGKVASYLCSVDPSQFETERSLDLHGDIEFLYIIQPVSNGKIYTWHLSVYVPTKAFYENSIPENMKLFHHKEMKSKSTCIDPKLKKKYYKIGVSFATAL